MEEIIARGNGNYIKGVAAKVAHKNGYMAVPWSADSPGR